MAFQLVYTSAAKLLDAGRSGYGTVARSKSITPLVVSAIERVSQFANLRGLDRNRVIHVHRRITAGSNRFHILTRIVDAGADYTGRTNHLAHHLVISQEEAARAAARGITPADVLRQFQWLERWDGNARFFDATEDVPLDNFRPDGRNSGSQSWAALTGNPAHARLLSWEAAPRTGVLIVPAAAVDTLHLLAEALAEFGPQSWSRSFTTSLETTDELSELEWVISTPSAFPEIQSRCGSRTLYDLTHPQTLPTPSAPVIATQQMEAAPQTANQSPGPTYQIPDPDTLRVPSAQLVKLRTSGGSSPRSSTSPPSASGSRKLRTQMILAGVVLILALGLFGVAAWKTIRPEDDKKATTGTEKQKKESDAAVEILKNAGIQQNKIKEFSEIVTDNPKEWADFATLFIAAIEGSDPINDISQLDSSSSKKLTSKSLPSWLSSLKKAWDVPFKWSKKTEDTSLAERLKSIDKISIHIREAAKDLMRDNLSKSCDKLVNQLIKEELKVQDVGKLPVTDVSKLFDNENKWRIFMKAVEYHKNPDPNKSLSGEEIIAIENAEFIPNAIKKSFKESHAAIPITKPPAELPKEKIALEEKKPVGPDLAGVKEKEVIVVSPDDLKNGVEVELLKRLLTPKSTTEMPEGLVISVDGQAIEKHLKHFPEKDHFADNWQNPKYNISTKGLVVVSNGECQLVKISYKNPKSDIVALITIDKKNDEPLIIEKLTLKFRDKKPDQVTVSGSLEILIQATKPNNSLKFIFTPNANVEVKFDGDICNIGRIKSLNQNLPDFIISEDASQRINNALKEYKVAEDAKSDPKVKKEIKENTIKTTKQSLLDQVMIAIGEAKLLAAPDFGKKVTWETCEEAKKIVKALTGTACAKEEYKKETDLNKGEDYVNHKKEIDKKNLNRILIEYGRHYIAASLKIHGKIDNEKDYLNNANSKKIETFINEFLQKSKVVNIQPSPDLADELKGITVSTKEGRILFKATKE